MRGAKIWILSGILISSSLSHQIPDLAKMHFGTFLRVHPESGNEWPWTEITFYPGDLFAIKNADSTCEDSFGHGRYEQKGDTLILKSLQSWSSLKCTSELVEDLILPEKKYLVRSHGQTSFEILSLTRGNKKDSNWTALWKYGARR